MEKNNLMHVEPLVYNIIYHIVGRVNTGESHTTAKLRLHEEK